MENRIRHQLKRAAGVSSLLALGLLSFNCMDKPLSPLAPTWDTQATIPLSVRSYTLADLLGRDSLKVPATQKSFPLTFGPTGGLFADTVSIGDTSGSGESHTLVDQKTANDFNTINIHVVIDNAIPLQFAVKLQFLDNAKRLLINVPQALGDSITVPPVTGGTVQTPSHTERIIELANTEIQQFNNSYSLAYFLSVSISGSNLQLDRTQAINIRVWAEFSYQVNK